MLVLLLWDLLRGGMCGLLTTRRMRKIVKNTDGEKQPLPGCD